MPGSYNEKITHLGTSLIKFTRLKELDLSRNSLISLDGLESLKLLEKLNLYYNNVSSLKELEKLRHNTLLTEIDLRLNPITKEENDYRLYLIYMLPSLKVLDDRMIKDSERQMALAFFDQTPSNNNNSSNNCNTNNNNNHVSKYDIYQQNNLSNGTATRCRSVSNIVKRSIGLNEQDILFDMNRYESASNLNGFDGNCNGNDNFVIKKPQAQEYSPKGLQYLFKIYVFDLIKKINIYSFERSSQYGIAYL